MVDKLASLELFYMLKHFDYLRSFKVFHSHRLSIMSTLKRPFAEFGSTARTEAAGDCKRLASSAHSFRRPIFNDQVVGNATNEEYESGPKSSFSSAVFSRSNESSLSESNSSLSANTQETSIYSPESSSAEHEICYGMASINHSS